MVVQLLKPVFIKKDPFRGGINRLVLCEVLNPDGTPHVSNHRRKLSEMLDDLNLQENWQQETSNPIQITLQSKDKPENKNDLPWFGWEQEYTLTHKPHMPL